MISPSVSKTYGSHVGLNHGEMLANRCFKQWKKLAPIFRKQNVGAFRLYDRDIPEVRAVVDWYEGHLVIGEYVREQTTGIPYLEALAEALQKKFGLAEDRIHLRRRQTRGNDGIRYQRLDHKGEKLTISEGNLNFLVNLDDYLDTGLYSDHRKTRSWIAAQSSGQRVLNLYAYTGAFTVYAAHGGAAATTTVDMSARYLDWALENLKLNGLDDITKHTAVVAESRNFLATAAREGVRWDLIILDPPSFSTDKRGEVLLDLQLDHPYLIQEALAVLTKNGQLYFSTNHQRFNPNFSRIESHKFEELTAESIPVDYQGRTPHRLFRFYR